MLRFDGILKPQNIEQGISNIEVNTSSFCGFLFCWSIFNGCNLRLSDSLYKLFLGGIY